MGEHKVGKDRARAGVWIEKSIFKLEALDEAGASAYLNTSQSKTDTPTKYFYGRKPDKFKSGTIRRIHYRLNPDNAVTYTLRIWDEATANNYESNSYMLYESPSGQVDDTDYDRAELSIPIRIGVPGYVYYSIEYSAAQGSCVAGFVVVSGDVVE